MRKVIALGFVAVACAGASARDLFVTSLGTDSVMRFNQTTGAFIDHFIAAGSGGMDGPQGIAIAPDGTIYVAAEYSHSIHRFSGTTGASLGTLFTGAASPNDIRFGPGGLLYYLDHGADRVRRFDTATSTELTPIMFSDGIHHSHGMTFGPDGLLYVGLEDSGPSTIRRLNPTTLTDMGTFATLGPDAAGIFGLKFLPGGDLVVTDFFHDSIRRVNGVSGIEMPPFAAPGSITDPLNLDIGPDGLLYVCSGGLGVQRYNPTTGASLGGFISGGVGSPFAPAWLTVPAPGPVMILMAGGLAIAARRRR